MFLLITIKFGLVIEVTLVQVSSALIAHVFFMDFFDNYLFNFPKKFCQEDIQTEKLKEFVVNTFKTI